MVLRTMLLRNLISSRSAPDFPPKFSLTFSYPFGILAFVESSLWTLAVSPDGSSIPLSYLESTLAKV
jgi:hypothetical protein